MRIKNVLFIISALTLTLMGCHLKTKRATAYHDKLLHIVQPVIDSSPDYGDAIQSYEKERAFKAHQRYSNLVNGSISRVMEVNDFEGDTILLHYSLELLGFYKNSLDNEFGPFLNSLKTDSFREEEERAADSLYMKFTSMQGKYWDRFEWAEKKFDAEYALE